MTSKGGTIKVDLLPTEKTGFRPDPMIFVWLIVIVGVVVGCMFWSRKLEGDINKTKQQIAQKNKEIQDIEGNLPVLEQSRARIKKLKEQIEVIKSLVYDPLRYANLLQEISVLLPPNVWLNTLSIDPTKQVVSFTGAAAEVPGRLPLETIADLIKNINGSRYFRDASLASTQETRVDPGNLRGFSFSIEAHYDPKAAATLPPTGLGNDGK